MNEFSSYFTKRDEFLTDYKGTTSERLRKDLLDNIFFTDLCMVIFLDFVQAVQAGVQDLKRTEKEFQELKSQNELRLKELKKLAASASKTTLELEEGFAEYEAIANEDDEFWKELGLEPPNQLIEETLSLLKSSALHQAELLALSESANQTMEELASTLNLVKLFFLQLKIDEIQTSLFEGVFKGRESRAIIDAMLKLLNYLSGFTPLGLPVATIMLFNDLKTVYETRVRERKTADDYNVYLETYSFSARHWSVTTQGVIDTIHALVQKQLSSLAATEAHLHEKIRILKSKWTHEVPVIG